MQFEEQSAAQRQMKELLRDQAKFRERLERVVRKIETSSERTAKLSERRKSRKNAGSPPADGQADGHAADGDGQGESNMETAGATAREAVTLSPGKGSL
jgi:hypothetical protein